MPTVATGPRACWPPGLRPCGRRGSGAEPRATLARRMTDQPADRRRLQVTVHNAVMHMANDQPLMADLFGVPEPHHNGLLCTNLRTLAGKRPIFADDSQSTFFFPWTQIRFLE